MQFNKFKYSLDDKFIDVNAIKSTIEDENIRLIYTIPLQYEFRPDLIAYSLYNDVTMADYLAYVNNIDNSPEGFYRFRKILAIRPEYKDLVCR